MKVYKFGGASVKDAFAIKNIAYILSQTNTNDLIIVVSAMGKTTNALENIIEKFFKKEDYISSIKELKRYHKHILSDLFNNNSDTVFKTLDNIFEKLNHEFISLKSDNYDYIYDQIVSYGELISTKIISAYLSDVGIENEWIDARSIIKTNDEYRDAKVNWSLTKELINDQINFSNCVITQGFIGSDNNNITTTLGREGSDYTAGIFAYCLDAKSVSIWKDVPGILTGDPKYIKNTELISKLSYDEAIELTYYGASIIHPKTIQPLYRKGIPLHVKSFLNHLIKVLLYPKMKQKYLIHHAISLKKPNINTYFIIRFFIYS